MSVGKSHDASSRARPLQVGVALAFVSAVLFGLSTPLVRHFGAHVAPFSTAACLYGGAALASAFGVSGNVDAPLRARDRGRVAFVALFGAVVAPASLAWGLARTSALLGSLLLASEALFTVLLARAVYREPVGRRVAAALGFIGLGSTLLVSGAGLRAPSSAGVLGCLAVVFASLAWAADNTLTRPLADKDPRQVVAAKSALGATFSVALAYLTGEHAPALATSVGLVVTGGLGYGTSLRLYLQAQRRIGAGRTGSVFATAPFLGAVAAYATGDGTADWTTVLAGASVAVGIYLHVSERHGHTHLHVAAHHEHAHRHDDGHHTHAHDPPFAGEHSHPHAHEAERHEHPHGSDLHHQHSHD